MADSEWLVLLNPYAGGGKTRRRESTIRNALQEARLHHQFMVSESREHTAKTIQDALLGGTRKFIGIGGDGTLNSLVNAVCGQARIPSEEVLLALIPVGTGNDWIKTQGLRPSLSASIKTIQAEKTKPHDVGVVINLETGENRYFINMAGCGFQGYVAERLEVTSRWLKIGPAAFILGLLDSLFRYRSNNMRIANNGTTFVGTYLNVTAGICRFSGGGMKLAPHALENDGLLAITLTGDLSKAAIIRNIPGLFSGAFIQNPKVEIFQTRQITVHGTPTVPVETDGEVLGYCQVDIRILPAAIRVICP